MMILIFHGYLKELFPDGRLAVEATSAAEAIASLDGHPGFSREAGDFHSITLPAFQSRDAIFESTTEQEIHVLPALEGEGGKGAILQIIIGAALIYFSAGLATGLVAAGMAGSVGSISASIAMSGAMMVLGGILQLLMPQPSISKDDTPRSNYLPANKNTVAIGTPIPLLVGRRRVYGHFLSFDIDAIGKEVAIVPPPAVTELPSEWADSKAVYVVEDKSSRFA